MLEIPTTSKEVENRAKTDVQRELPESNPFLRNSWLSALIVSFANRIFDFYLQLTAAIKESFPDTATGTFLERWAAIFGKQRLAATQSTGNVVATGTAGGIIPNGTVLTDTTSNYTTTSSGTIAASSISITTLVRSATTATATTASDHGLANNVPVTISGAVETEYNVSSAAITVTGLDTFEYQVAGSPTTPATGTILADFTSVNIPVQSVGFGADTNQDAGATLSLQSPIVNVDSDMVVDFGAIGGGTDQEDDVSLRGRTLERIQEPVAHFNVSDIVDKAKEVAGVTRVFVQEVTPAVGQVTIYFMRDLDANPIPTASEVTTTKDKILEIKPANTSDADVIVAAPTPVSTDFTFSALSPNTSTMQTAITSSLASFFDESTDVGVNIDEDAYRSAIFNTVDTATGDTVLTFTLSTPATDVTISTGEIGVLGNVVYP